MEISVNHKASELSSPTAPEPHTRTYRSPLRDGQAAETRLRILTATAQLFATAGYDGTSLSDIAREANVSLGTMKASGPKRDLLLAAFEHSFAGVEGVDSLSTQAPIIQITADVDNTRYLAGIIHFVAESNRRSSRLWATLVSAAVSDTVLSTKLEGLKHRRRLDALVLIDELRRRDLASPELARETLADAVSFTLSPEGYNQLVLEANWAQADYEAWLVGAVKSCVSNGASGQSR